MNLLHDLSALPRLAGIRLATVISGPELGRRLLFAPGLALGSYPGESSLNAALPVLSIIPESCVLNIGGAEVLLEILDPTPTLCILGVDQVTLSLIPMAKQVGFHATVSEERESLAQQAEDKGADPVYCMPPMEALHHLTGSGETYFLLRLSDPLMAQKCVETLLPRPWAYLGVAADEGRMVLTKKRLLQKGFAPEQVEKMQNSMGLDIGAVTPEEQALAISAELVSVRRSKAGLGHYPKAMLERAKSGESVLATVIHSDGLPSVGEKLLNTPTEQIGTFGDELGAAIRSAALAMLKTKETVKLLQRDGLAVLLERMELTC